MKLAELNVDHVRRAVEIYMEIAWPEHAARRPIFDPARLDAVQGLDELFALCERPRADVDGPTCPRYVLRLGNARYPFMKFVVQEYLVDEEYFFSVDTHDDHIVLTADHPDYAAFQEIREYNRELKQKIEQAWVEAGLPTHRALRRIAEVLAEQERDASHRGLVLVVDDEVDVAEGVAALLAGRGYGVETAHDGRQVLERLARDPLPDLVILDYAMPELDGEEVLRRLREQPRTRDLPVLLATASSIELERMGRVSGLLRKPYPRAVLFALVERLLGPTRPAPASGRGAGG